MNTVLLTGGTGFIGSHVCRAMLGQGLTVYVLSRNPERARSRLPDSAIVVGDLAEISQDSVIDTVVNLSGEPLFGGRWTAAKKRACYDSRIGMTERLWEFFQTRRPPEIVLSGSAIGYYGDRGDELLDEHSVGEGGFAHQLCVDWEAAASRFQDLGSRVCLLRIGLVLGRGGGLLGQMLTPFKMGLGGVMGSGKQWMSWIHIDDVVGLVFHLGDGAELNGPFNITAPNPVTNKQFTRALAAAVNRPAILPVPKWSMSMLLGEAGSEITASQRAMPDKATAAGYDFQYSRLEGALANLLT